MKKVVDLEKIATIKLYANDRFTSVFSRIRFWDAPFSELKKLVPLSGNILDLGCGDGLLINYLALHSTRRNLVGVELNKTRIKQADKGLPNTKFVYGDVLKKKGFQADTVLMIHLLHHLESLSTQEKLMKEVYLKLKKGGQLIIAEVDQKPFWKYVVSWLTDAFVVPILFEKKLWNFAFYYRTRLEWTILLKQIGFKVRVSSAHTGKPFSHIVLVATK